MNALADAGLTILGGVLSAGAGVIVARYQLSRQDKNAKRDWYARNVLLSKQVKNTVDRYKDGGTKYVTVRVIQTLSTRLRDQASNAPSNIDSEVAEALDKTAYYCESSVAVTPEGSTQQEYKINKEDLDNAKNKADNLKTNASKHTPADCKD